MIPEISVISRAENADSRIKYSEIEKAENVIGGYIDESTNRLFEQNSIQQVANEFGNEYITNFLGDLRTELLQEIHVVNSLDVEKKYYSLNQEPEERVTHEIINGTKAQVFQCENQTLNQKAVNVVNMVFPCRNSSELIDDSYELLASEIMKSKETNFNIVFQVNNTNDNTIQKILTQLKSTSEYIRNANFYIIETHPSLVTSLPGSLNIGYSFLRSLQNNKINPNRNFFTFWDDELKPVIPTAVSIFESNIELLLSSPNNKAISGYMIDTRTGLSRWHELCKGFSSDLRFIQSKPYIHGGAGVICRFDDYPIGGIKNGGIADTDLSEHLLNLIDANTLKQMSWEQWPIRINPKAPVFHPIETNILNWTIKYLQYQIAWDHTFKSLSDHDDIRGEKWNEVIQKNRSDFHSSLELYLHSLPVSKIIERAFMRSYYLTIKETQNKSEIFSVLKSLRQRSFEMA